MKSYDEISKFTVNGNEFDINDEKMLFLIPERLGFNLEKVDNFYKNENYFNYELHSGLKVFEKKIGIYSKFGYKDKYGNIKIPAVYDSAYEFSNNLARVYSNDTHKFGYINPNNEMVKNYEYLYADDFKFGLARVKVYNHNKGQYLWGYISQDFSWYKYPNLLEATNYNGDFARIKEDQNASYKLMDNNGNFITPLNDISIFNDDLIKFISTNNNGKIPLNKVIDINDKDRTFDNKLICSLDTQKKIDKMRIKNLTNLAILSDSVMAYNLETRTCDIVTSFVIGNIRSNILVKK